LIRTLDDAVLTDIDEDFDNWLREAYAVGQQRHLRGRRSRSTA
jgi:hypothetical protein